MKAMKLLLWAGLSLGASALCLAASPAAVGKRPEAGQPAPAFALEASTGKTIRLADFKGQRSVVLAFFPKAFTGG